MNSRFFLLSVISIFISCYTSGQEKNVFFDLDNENGINKLIGTKLNKDELFYPCHIKWMKNNLFITSCANDSFGYKILNVSDGRIVHKFGMHGRGPGELLFPDYIQMKDNRVIVYDFMIRKLVFYDYQKILMNERNIFLNEILFPNNVFVKVPLMINNNTIACILYGDNNGARYAKLTEKGKLIKKLGSFPKLKKDYPKIVADPIFKTNAEYNSLNNKIIIAYELWDRIEILDTSFNTKVIIKGPKNRLPKVYFEGGANVSSLNAPTCYADISVGPDSFIVLYYGLDEPDDPNKYFVFKYAIKFDYEGNTMEKFMLQPGVSDIAVDWENNMLFGVNMENDPIIYKYSMKK